MRARPCGSVSGRYRAAENFLLTKHVVAAGTLAKDAGSTPAASTIFFLRKVKKVVRTPDNVLTKSPMVVKRGHTIVKVYVTPTRGCDACTIVHYLGNKRQGPAR